MSAAVPVHPLRWLAEHDRDLVALRRAARAAIVMPAMFALGDKLIADPVLATFAAFGSFAMLLLVDFGGPMRERLPSQAALALAGCALVSLATLSRDRLAGGDDHGGRRFRRVFSGVVSSVLAGATTSLLLAFILPVTVAGPVSSIPDRLAGWGLAAAVARCSRSRCCGRRRRATRCAQAAMRGAAGRWPRGCARRSPNR